MVPIVVFVFSPSSTAASAMHAPGWFTRPISTILRVFAPPGVRLRTSVSLSCVTLLFESYTCASNPDAVSARTGKPTLGVVGSRCEGVELAWQSHP
eukprot:3558123-Rhodomonas_salina.4